MDRLLGIILELQRKGMQRAEDLAATFETSKRTIYRDIQALCEAGVPIAGATGQGYTLMEGYFLPPISFTVEEAVTMLVGLDFVEQQFDDNYREKACSAREKIETILPATIRHEVTRIRSGMRLIASSSAPDRQAAQSLEILRQAVKEERRVRFHYIKSIPEPDGNRQSVREVDPYGLSFVDSSWALVGFCHLRQELRTFRLKRMSQLAMLDERIKYPKAIEFHAYQPEDNRNLEVRLLVQPTIADKVKESRYYFIEKLEEVAEGLLVTLKVRQQAEILQWVLGWGAGVQVLEPESLRSMIRAEVEKMLLHY